MFLQLAVSIPVLRVQHICSINKLETADHYAEPVSLPEQQQAVTSAISAT